MSDFTSDVTGWISLSLLLILVAVILLMIAYVRANRVDRLHRQVLGARATVEAQLVLRAQAADDLACSGLLDAASAMILTRAAHAALETEGPIVDDGLDPQALSAPVAPTPSAGEEEARARAVLESELSRVLRAVLDTQTRAELAQDTRGVDALARLDRAAYRLQLARSFHNTHVAEARRLRGNLDVRLLHLAGRAPMPATFDMDDLIQASSDQPARATPGAAAASEITTPEGRTAGPGGVSE